MSDVLVLLIAARCIVHVDVVEVLQIDATLQKLVYMESKYCDIMMSHRSGKCDGVHTAMYAHKQS